MFSEVLLILVLLFIQNAKLALSYSDDPDARLSSWPYFKKHKGDEGTQPFQNKACGICYGKIWLPVPS